MLRPLAESDPAAFSAAPRRSRGAIGFAIGFSIAAALTVVATIFAVSGAGLTGPASPFIVAALVVSLLICVVLAIILGHRIRRIARGSSAAATGARLHLRFVSLFSLAAVTPALIVAVFLGAAFSQGVEEWFSTRVRTVVENAADVGRSYVDRATEDLSGEVLAMAEDLNLARRALVEDSDRYGAFLVAQAQRRALQSAYVLDADADILARAEESGAAPFERPPAQAYTQANEGHLWIRFDESDSIMRALYRLRAYDNAYLYVASPLDPGMVPRLRQFEEAVIAYRDAESSRGKLQTLFAASYFSVALLVLLGAVWVGLTNASRIAEPIGGLASAARRVAAGDLSVRVPEGAARDEVDALGSAFNQMTERLETQRRDLVAAQEEAETRSRFIQAVLSGVSAGVIGLDRDGRIIAANRSAAALLGHGEENLAERRLIDVAPELAELLNHPTPQGETRPHRVDIVRGDFSVHLSVRMSPDPEGALVLTFDDMTKLISAQRQEAWKDVARRIAHEIRNPLTPIQLSAERLKRKYSDEIQSDPETFQRCTETIIRQVNDIGRMVDEFSSFARMPTPRMAFADLSDVVRSTVFSQRLVFPDIRIEVEGVDRPIALVCDERLIGQALLNLVKNAAESVQARRARDNGEPKEGFVCVRLRDLDYGVQFEVIDNGLGFPTHDRARLIEPYFTTRTKGTGLGLAIVARIIEDHGGLIELDDAGQAESGAVVRFVLPKRGEDTQDQTADVGQGVA